MYEKDDAVPLVVRSRLDFLDLHVNRRDYTQCLQYPTIKPTPLKLSLTCIIQIQSSLLEVAQLLVLDAE